MDRSVLIQFIQNVLPLPAEKVEFIASHFRPKELAKNEVFIQEERICNEYLFLESGLIRAYTLDLEGNEVTTELYADRQIVFEVGSFFQKTPSRETYQALEDSRGWYLTFDQLNELFHGIVEFREFGRMILVKGFISFKQRTLSLINESAEKRYESLMQNQPLLLQKTPLKYIASYLGITDSSLSRIRRELQSK